MSHAIPPGLTPPVPDLEREEPEQSREDDIPADDGTVGPEEVSTDTRPLRNVERE